MANILAVECQGAAPCTEGISVDRVGLSCVLKVVNSCDALLKDFSISIDPEMAFSSGEFLANGNIHQSNLFTQGPAHNELGVAVRAALEMVDRTLRRYSCAFKDKTPVERTSMDCKVLAFNESAYKFSKLGGRYIFLPGTSLRQEFIPSDPRSLHCPEPSEDRTVPIDSEIVTGCRIADGGQLQLPFDGQAKVTVLISLQGIISEVSYLTTMDEGQGYWNKITRMTAIVLVKRGQVARIMGTPTFVIAEE